MKKAKQIEEMANDLAQHCPDLVANCCGASSCVSCLTRFLYEAGYRKQSEGEWKPTTEPLGVHEVDCVECSVCGESWVLDEDFDYDVVKDFWSFCPNCGAKMKGGE